MIVSLAFRITARMGAFAAFLLLAIWPEIASLGFGHPRLPAVVHAVTLGVLVSGYYALQGELLARAYGRPLPWPWLSWAVLALHLVGVATMLSGYLGAGFGAALQGAHYIVPAGVLLHAAQSAGAACKRPPGAPRRWTLHMPLAGLAATMALGAMLILDAATHRYGLYTPRMLLVHGLTGATLFVLPALWLHDHAEAYSVNGPSAARAWVAWGVGAVALGLIASGLPWPVTAGLTGLGAGWLWFAWSGLRKTSGALPRLAWIVPGMIALFAAGRYAAGLVAAIQQAPQPPAGEPLWLSKLGASALLLVAALPGMVGLLRREDRHWGGAAPPAVQTGALMLAGALIASASALEDAALARTGAVGGMAAILLLGNFPLRGK